MKPKTKLKIRLILATKDKKLKKLMKEAVKGWNEKAKDYQKKVRKGVQRLHLGKRQTAMPMV